MTTTDFKWPGPFYSLGAFSALNWMRNVTLFKQGDAKNEYWITAMTEELGEIAGAVKKFERGFNEREHLKMIRDWKSNLEMYDDFDPDSQPTVEEFYEVWAKKQKDNLAKEAADIFIYLDLFCTKNNINLWEAIKSKFNQVSDEMNCPDFKIS